MTRKDYILLAEALGRLPRICSSCGNEENYSLHKPASECKPCHNPAEHHKFEARNEDASLWIAEALERDNPRFNKQHFLAVVRGEKNLQSRPARKRG